MEYQKEILLDEESHLKAYTNYQNAAKIHSFACDMHGEKKMRSPRTWVYRLSSPEKIARTIKNGGEYILLKRQENPVGLACFCFQVSYRPRDNPRKTLKIDEWEIGSLLIHENFRGRGYSRALFRIAMETLKEKKGVDKAYVIITGTFDYKKLGEPREMSKGVVNLCKDQHGKLIGYGEDSFGPVYELDLSCIARTNLHPKPV
jgi:GNAT superfamily N-acetyltransferase